MSAKATMDYLMTIEKRISEHNDKVLTLETRKALYGTIKELTKGDNGSFFRKDDGKSVGLYWGKERADYGMAPDIFIGIDNENKIYVDTWALWKTIKGYDEMIQEQMG